MASGAHQSTLVLFLGCTLLCTFASGKNSEVLVNTRNVCGKVDIENNVMQLNATSQKQEENNVLPDAFYKVGVQAELKMKTATQKTCNDHIIEPPRRPMRNMRRGKRKARKAHHI